MSTIALRSREGDVRAEVHVDAVDFPSLRVFAWTLGSDGYAYRDEWVGLRHRRIAMHRQLLGLTFGDSLHTDHINGNRLDNRRANLRVVTQAQNNQNVMRGSSRSGHRNVYYHAASGLWRVAVSRGGKQISGGYFAEIEDAVAAAVELRRQHLPFAVERSVA